MAPSGICGRYGLSKQKEVPFIKGTVNVRCLSLTEFTCRAGMGGEASRTDWKEVAGAQAAGHGLSAM